MPLSPEIQTRLEELIAPLLEEIGLELVMLELTGGTDRQILRVTLDGEEGVGIDALKRASKQISPILDVEDPFPFDYNLEVSSPGIFRELIREKDFVRFKGSKVKVKYRREGYHTTFGLLLGLNENGQIGIETEEGQLDLLPDEVVKINLNPDL